MRRQTPDTIPCFRYDDGCEYPSAYVVRWWTIGTAFEAPAPVETDVCRAHLDVLTYWALNVRGVESVEVLAT